MTESVRQVTTRDGIEAGIELWNDRHPEFAIREEFLAQNVFAPFPGVSVGAYGLDSNPEQGFAIVKRPLEQRGDYPAGSTAWISLAVAPDRESTTALLDGVAESLADEGVETVAFGGDPQHFLPGVPMELGGDLREGLADASFEFGETVVDLTRRLDTDETPSAVKETRGTWDCRLERAIGRRDALLNVLEEFSGRWQYEAEHVARLPGGLESYWLLYAGDAAVGFIRASTPESPFQAPGRNWADRFAASVVGVGPLGIRPADRGRGWGLAMIDAVLSEYVEAGYGRAVIDWTEIPDFYERLGFEVCIEYEYAERSL